MSLQRALEYKSQFDEILKRYDKLKQKDSNDPQLSVLKSQAKELIAKVDSLVIPLRT